MKQRLLTGLVGVWFGVAGLASTAPVYQNTGTITDPPPQVDATVFINSGDFTVSSGVMFDTANTLYYTNTANGLMSDSAGFRFHFDTNGFQYLARAFNNAGLVEGGELRVKATNLINSGIIDGLNRGLVRLEGINVDLSHGGLRADASGTPVAAYNTLGTRVSYVANGTNNSMLDVEHAPPLDLTTITYPNPVSPMHDVYYPGSGGGQFNSGTVVPLSRDASKFAAFAYTNQLNPTSVVVQVLFVSTNLTDTNMSMQAGFVAAGRGAAQAVVQWSLPNVDIVDATLFTNYVTLVDNLLNVESNWITTNFYYNTIDRTINYSLYQGRSTIYPSAQIKTNTAYDNTLIIPSGMTNTLVTNTYAGWYGAVGLDTVATPSASLPINPALYDPTNAASRVEVVSENLDLTAARMRAGSVLDLRTKHLLGNVGVEMDAPIIRWDIGSTNSSLVVSNLAPVTVARIAGTIQAYSTVWTNTMDSVGVDSTGAPATNTITVFGYAMYVDHSLFGVRQVQIYDASFHATNVALYDNLYITKQFTLDADSLYLGTSSVLAGDAFATRDWSDFTRLNYVTNDGTLDTGSGTFTFNRPQPMTNFVNRGSINSAGVIVGARTLQNSGTLKANTGAIILRGIQEKLDGGTLTAAGDVNLITDELKIRQAAVTANAIYISANSQLTDGGPEAVTNQSVWSCNSGFSLASLPAEAELRGTRITSTATRFRQIQHSWPGKNYGATPAGFTNNAALGGLILDGAQFTSFAFTGTDTNVTVTNKVGTNMVVTNLIANGLYVDYLELRNFATNYLTELVISSNITLYFAAANLPVEQLDGAFNGRLRWVRDYHGPASSTNVTLADGSVISVNLGVLTSTNLDSDADGVVNASDSSPFDGAHLINLTLATNDFYMSWTGAAQTAYSVDYATNVYATNNTWIPLLITNNPAPSNVLMTVKDPVPPGADHRYYRVRYTP